MAFWSEWFGGAASAADDAAATARQAIAQRAAATDAARRMAGGRLSLDESFGLYAGPQAVLPPPEADQDWRLLDLDAETLERLSPSELMELLAELSPDVSRALWDFLRLFNPGWTATARRPGAQTADTVAQAALDAFWLRIGELYGAPDVALNRLALAAFLRGAFCAELVLDAPGRLAVDLATPDPASLRFRLVADAVRGPVWRLCQWQAGRLVDLDRTTIAYAPVDPLPGVSYGRPLAAPALFASLFLLGLLHDLRRVVAQQGYPRLDLVVGLEKLQAAMPADLEDDPTAAKEWIAAVIKEVQTVYGALEPDDAYIHTDVVTVNRPVGAIDAASLGAVDGLIKGLERMLVRALKTMPLLMASPDGASEANANRQWEVHAAGIKALQHLAEGLLERLLTLALRAEGLQAEVQFRFGELRAAELLRDEQVQALKAANAKAAYEAGWISQDEAAQYAVGHPADQAEPRAGGVGAALGGLLTANPEPGAARGQRAGPSTSSGSGPSASSGSGPSASSGSGPSASSGSGPSASSGCDCGHDARAADGQRVKIIPDGADEELPAIPNEVAVSETDIARAMAAWDAAFPDYAGLLDAEVENQQPYNTEAGELATAAGGQRAPRGPETSFVWDDKSKRYRNRNTGRYINQKTLLELRDSFTQGQRVKVDQLAERLIKGEVDLPRWVLDMRREIRETYIAEYMAAHGGRQNMTSKDWGIIGRMCRDQYGFLNGFAKDLADGMLSPAQIRQRAALYINSSVQAFERGASEVRGLPVLEHYPGDGGTDCRSNCKCWLDYNETETQWSIYWRLTDAEHCEGCLDLSAAWNPLVIAKTQVRTL